jgi:hypothetical protein
MDDKIRVLSDNLKTQWQDHFHMRDQTWKVLQYSILFFLGVVGLEIKGVEPVFLILAYASVIVTSAFGLIIALHHRRREKEKFKIIGLHEKELGIDALIKPVLEKSKASWTGKINTSAFIVVIQALLCALSACLLGRILFRS